MCNMLIKNVKNEHNLLMVNVGQPSATLVDINPLSPHDALKHHFTSLKTDLIFLQPRLLEREFP